ncbi:MAG: hypothetical protein LBJ46_04215 [Planctomycetota bacterium]|jgi:hypothetical protein|nr:hypothetical protein [Planctomycetota bacterium]
MLTISKPTLFAPDGFAVRGQCNPDSPGWQLRWFHRGDPPTVVWQGAFKTCRHLQFACSSAATCAEAEREVAKLLKSDSFTHFASMPTDIYPVAKGDDEPASPQPGQAPPPGKKRRKRRRR